MTNILILNVGSSSLKFSVLDESRKSIISGKCDRIGSDKSYIEIGDKSQSVSLPNFEVALDEVINIFKNKNVDFDFIAHRIVHGGEIRNTCEIDENIKEVIDEYSKFAPLHNPNQLDVINICEKYGLKQYGVFDTSFYSDMPKISFNYAINKDVAKEHNIRKYGFHGISHKSVIKGIKGKTISCHLGNGSSITASIDGKVVDTSMGLTPLAGVIMATRSGDVDPSVVTFLQSKGINVDFFLNNECGFKGICGITDIREIVSSLDDSNVKLAYDMFINSVVKYIGSFVAVLGGVDNLIFTGGIGEHIGRVRCDICDKLKYLGVEIEDDKNFIGILNRTIISTRNSNINIFVKSPCEEEQIADEVLDLLGINNKGHREKVLVEVSARHIHLCKKDLEILFGKGYELTKFKDLSQPGQFACNEKVAVVNENKKIEHIRILGPLRDETQVELSMTDCFFLGIKAPVRMSGDLEGTTGIKILGLNGETVIDRGVIVAKRHIHISPLEARKLGVVDREEVNVKIEGEREVVYDNVVVRVSPKFRLAMHIDTDEGNACESEGLTFGFIEK